MLPSFVSCLLFAGGFAFFLVRPVYLLDSRIVGGKAVDIKNHPYQLSLQKYSRHTCGASIISNKWCITAAHCVSSVGLFSGYSLCAGSNDKYGGVCYRVKRVFRHPAYNPRTIDCDIALLEVFDEIRFNDGVQPVKLAEKEPASGVMVNVTGWGTMKSNTNILAPVLMGVSIPIVNKESCRDTYKPSPITDSMMCAGYAQGGKDSCQGDSGGPLTANGILFGIVSWGYGCALAGYPGVYTNVACLRDWIKSISGV